MLIMLLAYPAARLGMFEWPRAYDPLALPDLRQSPNFLTRFKLKLIDSNANDCLLVMTRAGEAVTLKPASGVGSACEVSGALRLQRLSTATLRPEDTRCAIAARLYGWERHVVQPQAIGAFGEPVAEILHFGSFSCRPIKGQSSMSEHASANAFDISGFRLKSGRVISVKAGWAGAPRDAAFLHGLRDGLCDWFNLTLSPDYNKDHADHFHVDMGWVRDCR